MQKRHPKGQMLLLLTLLIPALLGSVAMGVDLTAMYWTWSRMQSAADSAVLAGAVHLPDSSSQARATATQYAIANGMLASEVGTPVVAANNLSISITLTRTVPFYFARVLNRLTGPVVVTSTSALKSSGSATGALPIGLSFQTTYAFGQSITLHNGRIGPGNWDGLALGCSGGSCFSNNLAHGYSGLLSVGQSVTSEPGLKTGPTAAGIAARVQAGVSADPGGTWSEHTLTDPRVAIVPVIDWTGCSGSCSVPIKGFAALWIAGGSGSDINIVFIGAVASGSQPSQTAANYGTYRAVIVN